MHVPENPALLGWLTEKKKPVDRNLFAVNLENFPVDHSGGAKRFGESDNANADEMGKSGDSQSDQIKERASLQTQATALRLFSTVMSSPPKALVNGVLVEEGNMIGVFRIVKIEPRRVVVEANDNQFEITMK